MGNSKPCVVFDLDGTLADTSGDLLAAANSCFRTLGLGDVLTKDQDAGVALRGGKAMLTAGFNRVGWDDMGEVDRQYQNLLDAYDQAIDHHTFLYPGAMQAVDDLRTKLSARVTICTNKPEGLARKLMTSLGVLGEFDNLIGADTLPVRKPDPAPLFASIDQAGGDRSKSVLIGDSVTDRETARNAGIPSVLVTFGPSGDDMAALQPERLLHSYSDLVDVVADLIG